MFVMYCAVWIVCNGVMQCNVCPVKRSGPGLVTEERREEEEKWYPVIRAPCHDTSPCSGHWHRTDTQHRRKKTCHAPCVLMFELRVCLFLITQVSLSLGHEVNRPDLSLTLLSWCYYHHQILSWEPYPVTVHSWWCVIDTGSGYSYAMQW